MEITTKKTMTLKDYAIRYAWYAVMFIPICIMILLEYIMIINNVIVGKSLQFLQEKLYRQKWMRPITSRLKKRKSDEGFEDFFAVLDIMNDYCYGWLKKNDTKKEEED